MITRLGGREVVLLGRSFLDKGIPPEWQEDRGVVIFQVYIYIYIYMYVYIYMYTHLYDI